MGKTILIVDDSDSMRHVLGVTLRKEGYEVIDAKDGVDALEKLDGTKISLIISDINMPNMDGITFIKEVKKIHAYRFTPICTLTTEGGRKRIDEGKDAGAKAWMVKPFVPQKLLETVSMLVMP